MRVSLFIPCFIDQCYPNVAMSMVKVFERLGHTVEYDERQTCCGQPAFNSGYWPEARSVAERMLHIFKNTEYIVSASGSCGAMLKVFYPELFKDTPDEAAALAMSPKVYEFSDFLVSVLGVSDVGARFPRKSHLPRRLPRPARTRHQAAAAHPPVRRARPGTHRNERHGNMLWFRRDVRRQDAEHFHGDG